MMNQYVGQNQIPVRYDTTYNTPVEHKKIHSSSKHCQQRDISGKWIVQLRKKHVLTGPLLLTWINFNPRIDK